MIIWDDHFHVDPYHGLFLEAVKQFHRAGGEHISSLFTKQPTTTDFQDLGLRTS